MAEVSNIGTVSDTYWGATSEISGVVTNISNSSVANIGVLNFDGRHYYSLLRGILTNHFFADKVHALPETTDYLYAADLVVPGPIANIQSGIEIGYNAFVNEISRVYPPIYVNRRKKNV